MWAWRWEVFRNLDAMIAYLIGGPQDMVKLHVRDGESILVFPHMEVERVDPRNPPAGEVMVRNLTYRKVYENHGREPYAIFALFGDQW